MTEEQGTAEGQTRLGAFDIACLVVGGIIGIGIFFTPAKVAAAVGGPGHVMAAWGIGGLLAILGGMTYAGLGRLVPGHGGVYAYLNRAYGPAPAFVYGWCNLLIIQSGAVAVVGLVMADYLAVLLGWGSFAGGSLSMARAGIALGAIVLLTLVNAAGVRLGRGVQVALTVLKTLAVFAIVVVAMCVDPAPRTVVEPPREVGFFTAMGAAILPVLFAFGGWQQGSFVAGIARRPQRDVPVGILCGVLVVVLAYLSVNLAYLDLLGMQGAAESKAIAVDSLKVALGGDAAADTASRVFAGIVVISALGFMNTVCMAPPYVLHAMSREGLFFRSVGQLHARLGTPVAAMMIQGVWACLLLLLSNLVTRWGWVEGEPLGLLLDGVVFVDWLFYGACGWGLWRLLRPGSEVVGVAELGILTKVSGLLFAVGAAAVTVAAVFAASGPALAGMLLLLLGVPAYRSFARRRRT